MPQNFNRQPSTWTPPLWPSSKTEEGSKSLPSFRFTLRINLQIYSMSSRFPCFFFLRKSMSSFTSLVVLALVFLLDNMVVNWNIQVSWILESLLKVQLLYFWYESFLAIEVCTQGTWSYWMKSVACCDKSLLIGRNALRSCEKAISLLWLAIRMF